MRFRRGMTVLERMTLREDILIAEIRRAHQRAREACRSGTCIRAMQAHGELAAELHGRCRGELPGNSGCLCECHDDNRSGVVSGTAVEMPSDTPESS